MINLIKKDLKLIFARKWIVVLGALALVLFTLFYFNYSAYKLIILMVYLNTMGTLTNNDKEDYLIHSLPVNKYEVVLAKYVLVFILFVISILFISIISLVFKGLNLVEDISYLNIDTIIRFLLAIVFTTGIGIPILIYFGRESRLGIFLNGFFFYFTFFSMNTVLFDEMKYSSNNGKYFPLLIVIIMIFMIISIFLSIKGFEKWEA